MTIISQRSKLRVALPSVRSRLHPKIMHCLSLPPSTDSHHLVFSSSKVEVFFLRPWDIPSLVAEGRLDAAFCGSDVIFELQADVEICQEFEEFRAPLVLCKRKEVDLDEICPLTVATEYARITKEYLLRKVKEFRILQVQGACEAYPHLAGVSAIVDIVETGATLRANSLEIVDSVGSTLPCLIQCKNPEPSRRLGVAEWRDLIVDALV
jgi:ATP phosphoribosyltransferase